MVAEAWLGPCVVGVKNTGMVSLSPGGMTTCACGFATSPNNSNEDPVGNVFCCSIWSDASPVFSSVTAIVLVLPVGTSPNVTEPPVTPRKLARGFSGVESKLMVSLLTEASDELILIVAFALVPPPVCSTSIVMNCWSPGASTVDWSN
jgi:hypothetical protein